MKNPLSVIILLCLPFMAIAQEHSWTTYFGPKEKEACTIAGIDKYFEETEPGASLDLNRVRQLVRLACDGGEQKKYTIYPNPTTGEITLQFDLQNRENARIEIYDITGAVIYQEQFEGLQGQSGKRLDLGRLANGLYFIRTTVDGNTYNHKIVKQY